MNCRRGRWRPLQDSMWLLVAVATISMVITLRLGDSLTWFRSRSDTDIHGVPRSQQLDPERLEHLTMLRSISNVQAGHSSQILEPPNDTLDAESQGRGVDVVHIAEDVDTKLQNIVEEVARSDTPERIFGKISSAARNISHQGTKNGDSTSVFSARKGDHIQSDTVTSNLNVPPENDDIDNYHSNSKRTGNDLIDVEQPTFKRILPSSITRATTKSQLKPRSPSLIIHEKTDKGSGPSDATTPREAGKDHITTIGAFSKWIQKAKASGRTVTDLHIPDLHVLYDKLSQIEKSVLPPPAEDTRVVVQGSLSSVKHHLPLVESAFHKYKASVTFQAPGSTPTMTSEQGDNWSIVMCLNTTFKGDNCVVTAQQSTKGHQKMNMIPELQDVVMSPHLLCDTSRTSQSRNSPGRWCGGKLPCYPHTEKTAKTIVPNTDTHCGNTSGWWVVADKSNGTPGLYFPCQNESALVVYLNQSSHDSVILPLPTKLLTLDGSAPLVWQVEILVTSIRPPRVYLHPDGLAWEGLQEFIHRKHQKNVSLLDLRQLITDLDSESTAVKTIERLETAVLQLIRAVEHHVNVSGSTRRLCQRCFQLLDAVVIFDSTFHPFILEVTSSPNSERLSSLSDYLLEQNLLEDLAAMLVSRETTAASILWGLAAFGVSQMKDGQVCSERDNFCLKEEEITYLLDTRREQRASKDWIRVFPSSTYFCQHMHSPHGSHTNTAYSQDQWPTSPFEEFVLAMESYFLCPFHDLDKNQSEDDLNIPVHRKAEVPGDLLKGDKLLNVSSASFMKSVCDNDANSLPYLSAIHTHPHIQLFPEFSPLTTEYQAYVDYNVILVQIRGVAKHCKMLAKLEDKHESSRWSNFSLGIGENKAHILVVDMNHMEPLVLNTYKVTIYRRRANYLLGPFDPNRVAHEVCSLKQDCSLPLSSEEPCGLQSVVTVSGWNDFLGHHKALPLCGADSVSGQWVVPCSSCNDESSCYWNSAIWQPVDCTEGRLSTDQLKECLADKKILFIGDSTNRGILHYILERLNGSLMQWDKTHNIRIYPDLNDGGTVFGFAYYPQFWLPPRERPMFDKALSELIKRTARWSDKKETVLVLGGVHWMAKHHLDMLVDGMQREGLSNPKVIVKGLGAGFHQPVKGVHQLSLVDQQRLSNQNAAVLSYASSHGFSVVDTFAMTMARYRDFLQGKCACHFHKVSSIEPSIVNKLSHHSSVPSDHHTRYHVDGDINAVYSEMVINRICAHNGG